MRRTEADASLLRSLPTKSADFIEPMECQSVSKLPEGSQWLWEIKLDGYRALAVKSGSNITLFSRRKKPLNRRFPYIVEPLAELPAGTVVDGELIGLDDSGRPDFNLLQNFRGEASQMLMHVPSVNRRTTPREVSCSSGCQRRMLNENSSCRGDRQ
jgi:ATP-dependent DNA ligase